MSNKIINTSNAPEVIGPYSQAVLAGETIYISGQIGMHSYTGFMSNAVDSQVTQVLMNVGYILAEAGFRLTDVVRTTIYLTDMNDYDLVNSTYTDFFIKNLPARTCVQVAGLPKGALFQMDAIAVKQ